MVQGCGWCSTNESDIEAIKERLKHVSESVNVKQFCRVLKEMKIKVRDVYWLFYVVTDRKPIVVNCLEEFIMRDFYSFLYKYKADGRTNFISHELVLYNILLKNGLYCSSGDFASLKIKHTLIYQNVFEKLGWEFFSSANKEKMEKYIIEFVSNLKTLDIGIQEEALKLAIANCVSQYSNSPDGEGYYTVDEPLNLCQHVYKKGKSKGQNCDNPTKSNFCNKHCKGTFKE